jgi:hypothetical protein
LNSLVDGDGNFGTSVFYSTLVFFGSSSIFGTSQKLTLSKKDLFIFSTLSSIFDLSVSLAC